MARTTRGNLTGRAAATERREFFEQIAVDAEKRRQRENKAAIYKCGIIMETIGADNYHNWLNTTPDDNMAFNLAVEQMYAEVLSAEQTAANLRAGAEVIARLDAEAQALELQAEADWLDLKRTQAEALGTLY